MTTHYKIQLTDSDVSLKLSYRSGKFFRLERTKGKLPDNHLRYVGKIIPPTENQIGAYQAAFADKVSYEAITKEKSQFSKFNNAWFSFYEDFTGLPPKFGAADGMHLKKIMKHLETVGGSQTEAFQLWETILAAWPKLSDFHKENTDLKYINSRLNVLLNAVKKAINTSTVGGTDHSASL